jgi:hypothetical protein
MLPLGCFLLWGREGVILQTLTENKRIQEKRGFPMKNMIMREGSSFTIVMNAAAPKQGFLCGGLND